MCILSRSLMLHPEIRDLGVARQKNIMAPVCDQLHQNSIHLVVFLTIPSDSNARKENQTRCRSIIKCDAGPSPWTSCAVATVMDGTYDAMAEITFVVSVL
jgi:hypothetical protein